MSSKKYYWLKLKKDHFRRHDMEIIEDMDNGKLHVLFYLKLLAESIDHEGRLRFSETIPYTENMLASRMKTTTNLVVEALKIFTSLGLMEVLKDGTIVMKKLDGMIGSRTEDADRIADYRRHKRDKESENKKEHKSKTTYDFDLLWGRYPNSIGKKAAKRHFTTSVISDDDWKNINTALDNYLLSARVKKGYVANGSTWFNNWKDWITLPETERWCEVCKNTGKYISSTGYESICKCPSGNRIK